MKKFLLTTGILLLSATAVMAAETKEKKCTTDSYGNTTCTETTTGSTTETITYDTTTTEEVKEEVAILDTALPAFAPILMTGILALGGVGLVVKKQIK